MMSAYLLERAKSTLKRDSIKEYLVLFRDKSDGEWKAVETQTSTGRSPRRFVGEAEVDKYVEVASFLRPTFEYRIISQNSPY